MSLKRNIKFTFRITEAEEKKIRNKIKKSKLTQNEFFLRSALDKEIIIIDGLHELIDQIRRLGINVNQLTKHANQGDYVDKAEIAITNKELKEIWQLLRSLVQKVH